MKPKTFWSGNKFPASFKDTDKEKTKNSTRRSCSWQLVDFLRKYPDSHFVITYREKMDDYDPMWGGGGYEGFSARIDVQVVDEIINSFPVPKPPLHIRIIKRFLGR